MSKIERGTVAWIRVWDLPVRLFHWALVLFITLSIVTGAIGGIDILLPAWMPGGGRVIPDMTIHLWSGLSILALVLFRIVWGLVGSTTARFAAFVRGPRAVFSYLVSLRRGPVGFVAGHNPAGAAMILAMLALLLAQAATGLFAKEEADVFPFRGPFNGLVSDGTAKALGLIHATVWWILLTLVALHIAANLYYWLWLKEDLISAMLTGRRARPAGVDVRSLQFRPTALAALILILSAAVVWIVIARFGQ